MRIPILVFLNFLSVQVSFACSCIYIENPCDNINNQYRIPVLVSFDDLNGQEAILQIEQVYDDDIELNDTYRIIADSVTSCNASLDNIEEGRSYLFGFPKDLAASDTIGYFQCMSPFYNVNSNYKLLNCNFSSTPGLLYIYPNPIRNHEFSIGTTINQFSSYKVYNSSGELVASSVINSNQSEIYTLPEELSAGIYVLLFSTEQGVRFHSKVVIL